MIVQTPKEYARSRLILAAFAFASGLPVGAILQDGRGFAAEVQVTSNVLCKVGNSLCADWSGLRDVQRVGDTAYTFTCDKYATFSGLEVKYEGPQ